METEQEYSERIAKRGAQLCDELRLQQLYLQAATLHAHLLRGFEESLEVALATYLTAIRDYEKRVAFGEAQPPYSEIEIPKIAIANALLHSVGLPTEPYIPTRVVSGNGKSPRHPVPVEVRWEVWERDNFTCVHCGCRRNLTIDHRVAVVNGGTNDIENLQTLCGPCNSAKGAR